MSKQVAIPLIQTQNECIQNSKNKYFNRMECLVNVSGMWSYKNKPILCNCFGTFLLLMVFFWLICAGASIVKIFDKLLIEILYMITYSSIIVLKLFGLYYFWYKFKFEHKNELFLKFYQLKYRKQIDLLYKRQLFMCLLGSILYVICAMGTTYIGLKLYSFSDNYGFFGFIASLFIDTMNAIGILWAFIIPSHIIQSNFGLVFLKYRIYLIHLQNLFTINDENIVDELTEWIKLYTNLYQNLQNELNFIKYYYGYWLFWMLCTIWIIILYFDSGLGIASLNDIHWTLYDDIIAISSQILNCIALFMPLIQFVILGSQLTNEYKICLELCYNKTIELFNKNSLNKNYIINNYFINIAKHKPLHVTLFNIEISHINVFRLIVVFAATKILSYLFMQSF